MPHPRETRFATLSGNAVSQNEMPTINGQRYPVTEKRNDSKPGFD
jgi:hypothetical protein